MQLILWLIAYIFFSYLLVLTQLGFLEPSVLALKTRLTLRPQLRDWLVHILCKSGPDLLLSSIIIFRGEDSKAVGKTHGSVFSSLLLIPGILCLVQTEVNRSSSRPFSPRFLFAALGLVLASLSLSFVTYDGQVTLTEASWLIYLGVIFQTVGIFLHLSQPGVAETELLVLTQTRALGAVGVLLLPTVEDHGTGGGSGSYSGLPGHSLLARVMVAAAVGTPFEVLAPAATAVAFFWVFVFSLGLDAVTRNISSTIGISGQLAGLTFVALGVKLPKIISCAFHEERELFRAETLERLMFASSVGVGLPWSVKAMIGHVLNDREEKNGGSSEVVSMLGRLALVLGTVGVAMVAKKLQRSKMAGALMCLSWVFTQTAYILLD